MSQLVVVRCSQDRIRESRSPGQDLGVGRRRLQEKHARMQAKEQQKVWVSSEQQPVAMVSLPIGVVPECQTYDRRRVWEMNSRPWVAQTTGTR